MKWFIILFVLTLSFLIILKIIFLGESTPFSNLYSQFGNSNDTSFNLNGTLFSLILLDDQNPMENDNSFSNLLSFNENKKQTELVDLLTSTLVNILTNKESSFSLNELLPNSDITNDNKYKTMDKLLVLNGSWMLDVRNGDIITFNAKISKISREGISPHIFEIINFIAESHTSIRLSDTENNVIKGTAEIITPRGIVDTDLYLVLQRNAISIILEPKILDSNYLGQPIYGSTKYINH
ncbi:MAG: hypothetical protein MRJ93_08480 [Nitrososphaeraceae archaeon]|nr:hypothetical protein [Nitrososphaeraceae archaeon]